MPIASSPTAKDSQAQITTETDLLPLKDDTRAYLITYFKRSTRPPASLVSVDPAGWYQMQQYLLRTASSHSVVMDALLALTQLISVRESTLRSSSSSQWRMAFELQQRSCRELGERRIDEKSQNALLAAIFLLAWFEVICDEQDAHRSNFPTDLAESVIRGSARWNSASRRLLQWLNSFDAKASHMGGRQLLTPKSLEVVLQHRFERSYRTVDSGDSENETVSNDSEEDDRNGSAAVFTQARKRRASSRSFTTRSFITPREIKMNVFNAIMQPALEFHLVSQSYSRKIGTHDRHHRSRNTVEDEYEVVTACKTIDTELKKLWRQRPRVLDLTAKDLSGVVCEDIAERLDELFAVYIATFWAHFLYIHRVAWWGLPHSSTAKEALDEFWRMMCRSVREPEDNKENHLSAMDRQKVIHPGLMWPMFMFGCEVEIGEKQQWSVTQLRLLGERTVTPDTEQQHSDSLPPYRLGQKGAQNAIRASVLLNEVVKRQNETGARVDGKYLSLELFGCHFTII
ncbi:hypothetical protein VE02_05047 [Pseudogymnoascus sp. 03VT05]|nr:hypothetical protein VE02_05047 [Pseudogymnoascus sp. 03VT05]